MWNKKKFISVELDVFEFDAQERDCVRMCCYSFSHVGFSDNASMEIWSFETAFRKGGGICGSF